MRTQEISTQDIVLAAALKTLGFRLVDIQKVGNKGIFNFKEVDSEVITDYDLGNLLVEPIAFNSAIKSLTTASRRLV
jgi:hypothetical protein